MDRITVDFMNYVKVNYPTLLNVAQKNLLYQYRSDGSEFKFDVVSHVICQLQITINNNPEPFRKMIKDNSLIHYLKKTIYTNCVLLTAPYIREIEKRKSLISLKNIYDNDIDTFYIQNSDSELIDLVKCNLDCYSFNIFEDYAINDLSICELSLKYGLSKIEIENIIEKSRLKLIDLV